MRRSLGLGLLAILLVAAGLAWHRATDRLRRERQAAAACAAADRLDWERTLELSARLDARDGSGRRALDCRCAALVARGRQNECVASLEAALAAEPSHEWLPSPPVAELLIEAWRDRGALPAAADLAHRAALRTPESFALLDLELGLRAQVEDESEVLADLRRRVPAAGAAADRLRLAIAGRLVEREQWPEALEVLGEEPAADRELLPKWHLLRAVGFAGLNRLDGVLDSFAAFERAGGDPWEARARYALLVSTRSLRDRRLSTQELLRQVVEGVEQVPDDGLRRAVIYRWIATLVVSGKHDRALAEFERLGARYGELPGLTREVIERSRSQRLLLAGDAASRQGRLVFRLAGFEAGDRLLVSAPPEEPVDTPYRGTPVLGSGEVELERQVDVAPVRWVVLDAAGAVRGSGTAWPVADATVPVAAERRAARPPTSYVPRQRPADGRRRVFAVVLDCGDWRLVQYGRARGELPVFEHLVESGYRAVLESHPPFTAIAVQALAHPQRRGVASFFGTLHQLGAEFEAMNFVGVNPFGALRWLLPPEDDLFTTLGRGELVVANMLRSYGPLRAGRHASITGPHGAQRAATGYSGSRTLEPMEEAALFAGLLPEGTTAREHLEEMAADFDTALAFARQGEVDLMMLRVDSLDLLTHLSFDDVIETEQDDGARLLHRVYRYVDRRLGELFEALDRDDILVVLSDHGIRTPLEHDRRALFVAAGGDVPPGRAAGQPALRGVGRLLADLLGVPTAWPATGIEQLVASLSSESQT